MGYVLLGVAERRGAGAFGAGTASAKIWDFARRR
jgi:hypothetical protein